jgi:alkanesulfonate monooxygenase SsuD/methylene tetrahydromethanopterin reductase-like flavin-dependent oxidoreductase (luciferase family)
MSTSPRFRLGFFSYLQGKGTQAEIYEQSLELFLAAEELGFDAGWVAQHHFGRLGGLPSPLVFFGVLAARTQRLTLGTAIISLPLEQPIRLAEDASVFETLFPGRLQLGIGTGFATADVLSTFDKAGGDRRALYDGSIERFLQALNGEKLNAEGGVLYPGAGTLNQRIWEAPSTLERVKESAARGSGLLLSRVAIGAGSTPSDQVQIPMVDLYKATLPAGVAPQIGLSRTIYPSRDPDVAYRNIKAGLEASAASRPELATMSIDEQIKHNNIHWGRPEDVVESLKKEPLLGESTDLICQVQPGLPSFEETLEAIELIATEVAPALGWQPAQQRTLARS